MNKSTQGKMTSEKAIKKRFLKVLKLGIGEAYLIQQKYPKIDFSAAILKGTINNFAYDAQSEGSRAKYIYGLIKKSQKCDFIIDKLLKKLVKTKEDSWDLVHMFDIAVLIAKDGNKKALKAIHERFDRNRLKGYEIAGKKQLMEISGIKGVLMVAEFVGELLVKNKNEWVERWLIDYFQENNPSIDVFKILRKKGKKNKFIQAYYSEITKKQSKSYHNIKPIKFTYEIVTERIKANKFWIITTEKAQELSKKEVLMLAHDFIHTKKKQEKIGYLKFFSKRKFPLDFRFLFKIASKKKETDLVQYAVEALHFFNHKSIRKLAIKKIETVENPCEYLSLLVGNYKRKDAKLLLEVINRSNDFDFIHSLIYGILKIYEVNNTKTSQAPLEAMYYKMNCGIHRMDLLKTLSNNNVLSDALLNDMQFDSYDGVREFYEKLNN